MLLEEDVMLSAAAYFQNPNYEERETCKEEEIYLDE